MNSLLSHLQKDFPDISFKRADHFYWSPRQQCVFYADRLEEIESQWTLLHETAHSALRHTDFKSDFHLIKLEEDAWQKTLSLCKIYDINPPDNQYIQDCIDTYRNWQFRRSQCPHCSVGGVQVSSGKYTCILCHQSWTVTKQRFCRAYRKSKTAA